MVKKKKNLTPIDIVIDPEEFMRMGQERDNAAASAMRFIAGLNLPGLNDRMTPDSVEKFLAKKGL